jgi:hypothetical protein
LIRAALTTVGVSVVVLVSSAGGSVGEHGAGPGQRLVGEDGRRRPDAGKSTAWPFSMVKPSPISPDPPKHKS